MNVNSLWSEVFFECFGSLLIGESLSVSVLFEQQLNMLDSILTCCPSVSSLFLLVRLFVSFSCMLLLLLFSFVCSNSGSSVLRFCVVCCEFPVRDLL